MRLIVTITLVLTFIVAICFFRKAVWNSSREPFKVLGAMGNQREVYYHCLSECERSDPGNRLTPTKGNRSCMDYCDSAITDLTRRGGASYPDDYPVKSISIVNKRDESYKVCGEGTKGARCRELYNTDAEIDEKCRQDCQYNTDPTGVCMELCAKSLSGNKSLGWSWK